ncbi:MAG: 3-phosphoshikimate 1-carboxyvinyltransferase [Clostridiales bacterium]|nr:3-phosphoshikimate 1-carboxyvinyltransferase [Clostridiales bacterium]
MMKIKIKKTNQLNIKTTIISSKSELHRLLILSAFAKTESQIGFNGKLSEDVLATINCLEAIGVKIEIKNNIIFVFPLKEIPKKTVEICPNESGSTLRFLIPVFSSLGINYKITVNGRLGERPLSPMYEILSEKGVFLSENGKYPLTVNGQFVGGDIKIKGNVSSQFITGILMALPFTKNGGSVLIEEPFESKGYVDITIDVMKKFGIEVIKNENLYTVLPKPYNGINLTAGGDWSNASFFLAMGAINGESTVFGLDINSLQGDKEILNILERFGAVVVKEENSITVKHNQLNGIKIDAKDFPDLVPVLGIVASFSKGTTRIYNASRLRIKESDRIKSVVDMINSLGGDAKETDDGMLITGKDKLFGGVVNSYNDHRIVMASAVSSILTENEVVISNANAVNKSYPEFFEILKECGFCVEEV